MADTFDLYNWKPQKTNMKMTKLEVQNKEYKRDTTRAKTIIIGAQEEWASLAPQTNMALFSEWLYIGGFTVHMLYVFRTELYIVLCCLGIQPVSHITDGFWLTADHVCYTKSNMSYIIFDNIYLYILLSYHEEMTNLGWLFEF